MQLSVSIWGSVLALAGLVTQVLSRQIWESVPDSSQNTQKDTTKAVPRCLCSVNMDDDRSPYNIGEINSYIDLEVDPVSDKNECRRLRHQCKHECAMKAELSARTESGHGPQLGYILCMHHGQVTSNTGLGVTSFAVLEGCPQHVAITPTVASQRLCCGHTSITLQTDRSPMPKQYTVFGWNPDCQAQTFILH